jgi:hypothetical protein
VVVVPVTQIHSRPAWRREIASRSARYEPFRPAHVVEAVAERHHGPGRKPPDGVAKAASVAWVCVGRQHLARARQRTTLLEVKVGDDGTSASAR